MLLNKPYSDAVELLKQLITIPSFSKQEDGTADLLQRFLEEKRIPAHRLQNNVWAVNHYFDPGKPTILLNSHHDTVKPNPQYTKDPFSPIIEKERLFGLGSNDAGGCLVSLAAAFVHFYNRSDLQYNIIFAATAEEEISGHNGIELFLKNQALDDLLKGRQFDCAIVGEPTKMDLAIAEKGLMVLDGISYGKAGHAAREEGENAIYKAMKDIEWLSTYQFKKVSEWLGPVKMSVTVIHTENKAHNMVPSQCSFVVDVRVTELYTHEEILETISKNISSQVVPRSMRMRSTGISPNHPLVKAGMAQNKKCYGSPTSSDKALMPFAALKCGPGDSGRSHTADEFIYLHEINDGIKGYIEMLEKLVFRENCLRTL